MNALVLDRQNKARDVWQTVLGEIGIKTVFEDSFTKELLTPRAEPRILVFDQNVIGDSFEAAAVICQQVCLDIAIVTGAEISVAGAVRLMKQGAAWVFRKELDVQQIREALPLIRENAINLANQIEELCRLQNLLRNISPREHSVLEMVLDGVSNKQIAKQLEVSVRTVESRRAKIYRKCDVTNVTELVRCVDREHQLRSRYGECPKNLRQSTSGAGNGSKMVSCVSRTDDPH
jgi:RNA polymerase sigma factor (sigma-70 family)